MHIRTGSQVFEDMSMKIILACFTDRCRMISMIRRIHRQIQPNDTVTTIDGMQMNGITVLHTIIACHILIPMRISLRSLCCGPIECTLPLFECIRSFSSHIHFSFPKEGIILTKRLGHNRVIDRIDMQLQYPYTITPYAVHAIGACLCLERINIHKVSGSSKRNGIGMTLPRESTTMRLTYHCIECVVIYRMNIYHMRHHRVTSTLVITRKNGLHRIRQYISANHFMTTLNPTCPFAVCIIDKVAIMRHRETRTVMILLIFAYMEDLLCGIRLTEMQVQHEKTVTLSVSARWMFNLHLIIIVRITDPWSPIHRIRTFRTDTQDVFPINERIFAYGTIEHRLVVIQNL